MSFRSPLPRHFAAYSLLLVGLAACGEAPAGPDQALIVTARSASTGMTEPPEPSVWDRRVWVCKTGSDATFEVSVDGGSPTEHSVAQGACIVVYELGEGLDEQHMVAVTEMPSLGTTLESIIVETTRFGLIQSTTTLTGTSTATVLVTWTKGGILTFNNTFTPPPPPPSGGGEGCTPGYWKQSQHFDSWVGYTPDMLFSSVFEDAFPGMTLLDVLRQGGGDIKALGRHTVAALLNAANAGVAYDIGEPADVIASFNAAHPGDDYEALKQVLAGFNEQGCSLN